MEHLGERETKISVSDEVPAGNTETNDGKNGAGLGVEIATGDEKFSSVPLDNHLDGEDVETRLGSYLSGGDRCGDGENGTEIEGRLSDIDIRDTDTEAGKPEETPMENGHSEEEKIDGNSPRMDQLLRPLSHLPQPNAPPGLTKSLSNVSDRIAVGRSLSENNSYDVPSIGKYIRDRSNNLSSALLKRFSSLKEPAELPKNDSNVTEIHLRGLKVVVQLRKDSDFKGRVSFFSRSNCRDCTAVRSFLREKGLKFVEINIDVFPAREKELIERTGNNSVPHIFLNEKHIGGLVALNSLRNSGEFDKRLREIAGRRCPESAPSPPLYGFDDEREGEGGVDEMVGIVRVLRQRLPIQDRLAKMKLVKNCFAGSEMVEVLIQHLDCGRKKAVEIGRILATKHFIHHVFRENEFEDGNQLYRFLEHEPSIPRCFNFRGTTNDDEPKPAAIIGRKLTKITSAILEAYASYDRRHVDYDRISNSEEFRRYVNLAQELQRVDVIALSPNERLAFFLNLYNAMVIHAVIRIGPPEGAIDRRTFYGDFHYIIGGYPYSLATIQNGILRSNRRQPYSLTKPFSAGDKRLKVAMQKVNPLIHFGLCNGTRSSPTVRFFSAEGIEAELRFATREFFLGDGMEVDLEKRTVHLTRIIKWYSADFGEEKEIIKWVFNYLDATKAGHLNHLLNDGGPIKIVYNDYDWSLNS